jgi:hypothetical protein
VRNAECGKVDVDVDLNAQGKLWLRVPCRARSL